MHSPLLLLQNCHCFKNWSLYKTGLKKAAHFLLVKRRFYQAALTVFPFASKEEGGKQRSPTDKRQNGIYSLEGQRTSSKLLPHTIHPYRSSNTELVPHLPFKCYILSFLCSSTSSLFPHHLTFSCQNSPKNNLSSYSRFLSPLGGS